MTIEEVKSLITSARSIEREVERMKQEIEDKRQELLSIKSSLGVVAPVILSEKLSMPERVCFRLEELYTQYDLMLKRQLDKRDEIESAITALEPIEQEIVRAWISGKTEEQIGRKIGYSWRTVHRHKKQILLKLANIRKS